MGSKGSNTTTQSGTSTYTANPATYGAGTQALNMAQNAASQPFNLPQAPVAGFQPDQQQAFQQYRDLQGMAQPYYDQARGLFAQSGAPISGAQISNYLNPYSQFVLDNLKEVQGQQMNDLTGRLTQAAGGVGADRIAVGQGELGRQQNLATGQTLANLWGTALTAAQQDAGRQSAAAYGIGNLGGAAQNAAIQGAGALNQAGNQQQAQAQNVLNSPYYNQLAQIAYPYQNAQYLAGITGSLAPVFGGTTASNAQKTTPAPSLWSQLIGAGTAAAGAYGAYNSGGTGASANGDGSWYGPSSVGGAPLSGQTSNNPYYGPGYAEGGEVFNPAASDASWMSKNPTIPKVDLKPPQMTYPKVDFQWGDDKGGGGSNPLGDIAKIAGSVATIAPLMSDRRLKENIKPIGETYDGQNIYRYNLKGSPQTQIGLMAQEVEQEHPEAVSDMGGYKGVDYKSATKDASRYADGGSVNDYGNMGIWNAGGFSDLENNPEKFLMNNLGIGITPWAKSAGRAIGFAQGGIVLPGMGMNYDDGGEVPLYPGIYKMQGNPEEYAGWQRSADVANGAASTTVDDGQTTLPRNAMPTSGGAPIPTPRPGPYSGFSPEADEVAQANARDMSGRTFVQPYGDLNHGSDISRKFARDPWMALIAAGAGMMSGDSPYAGINIGKGLQAGVSYLGEQRKASREEESVNQRARQLAMEADRHRDTMTKLTPAQAATIASGAKQRKLEETRLEYEGWKKGEANVLTGDTPWFNARTGESGILRGSDGKWVPTNAGTNAPTAPSEPGTPGSTGAPAGTSPAPAPGAGSPQATQPQAATKPTEEEAPMGVPELASNMEPANAVKDIGFMGKNSPLVAANAKENATVIAQQAKDAKMLGPLKQGIDEMRLALKTLTKDKDADSFISQLGLQPGMNAIEIDKKLNIMRAENAIRIANGQKPHFDPEKLAAAETINKVQSRLGMSFASQLSPREAFAGQKIGIESTPGLTQSEVGVRRLLSGLEAAYEEGKDQVKFYNKYLKHNKGYALGWREDFVSKNEPGKYVVRSLLRDLPQDVTKHLKEDVETLRKNPTPENVRLFNKHYRDTSDYFLRGGVR